MRFLIDMNLTPRSVQYLLDSNHECRHWAEIGPIIASDATICAHAREHGFVVITNDLDFPQILARTAQGKPSVILLRTELFKEALRYGAAIVDDEPLTADRLVYGHTGLHFVKTTSTGKPVFSSTVIIKHSQVEATSRPFRQPTSMEMSLELGAQAAQTASPDAFNRNRFA